MEGLLTPPRGDGSEILDGPNVDPEIVYRSLRDVAKSNFIFGGSHAAISELKLAFPLVKSIKKATLLDVGTGIGDIPALATKSARKAGITLNTIGLDNTEVLAAASGMRTNASICGDALRIPLADESVDFVMASQILHHFSGHNSLQFLREMNRVARLRVIISDLRRSRFAAGGLWLASFPLGFHPISRHDGVVSVMKGFTAAELSNLVNEAIGQTPIVRKRIGFRLTTSWSPRV